MRSIPATPDHTSHDTYDGFIASRLPSWITSASASQLHQLRQSLNNHHASQARLRALTLELQSPIAFAEELFIRLLKQPLPTGMSFSQLQWLQVFPRFSRELDPQQALPQFPIEVDPQQTLPRYGQSRDNGLRRLMRNFIANTSFYDGTGLVAPGSEQVLSGASAQLVQDCRTLDAGKRYQDHLYQVLNTSAQGFMVDDKRTGLKLAADVAALKGDIDAHVQAALHSLAGDPPLQVPEALTAHAGLFTILDCQVADGLWIQLRDHKGNARGGVLYLPSDPVQALRAFDSEKSISATLAAELGRDSYRQAFIRLIGLEHRASFVKKLTSRLGDDDPDLKLDGSTHQGDIFLALVTQQIRQIKEDARRLLPSTAEADSADAQARDAAWKSAGLDVLNLSGLFIPVVGGLLLGQLVAQTLTEVFEGVQDWSRGHQHEALEHMLGVAETVASTAATVAGVTFVRSAFVSTLEPVRLASGIGRLWQAELAPYASTPDATSLRPDGTYGIGKRRWIKLEERYFEVERPEPCGSYRLRHPSREGTYGPVVLHNGERCWRLLLEDPGQWSDSGKMLERLWPQPMPLDDTRTEQILQIAGIDEDELRGLLMENRQLPANLRETLRAFDAQARMELFFEQLQRDIVAEDNIEVLRWCESQAGIGQGTAAVLAGRSALRGPLLSYLLALPPVDEPLLKPLMALGLPQGYAQTLAAGASHADRQQFITNGRLPRALATRASTLLPVAKITRALTGLYLPEAYTDATGELALALLDAEDIGGLSLDLIKSLEHRESLKLIGAGGQGGEHRLLVRESGQFVIYDGQGHRLASQPPAHGSIFDALRCVLESRALFDGLDLGDGADAAPLQARLLTHLPQSHTGMRRMLGWPTSEQWFNPGQRLPDGRVGYLLNGRGAAAVTPRERMRVGLLRLFPGVHDSIEQELDRWMLPGNSVADMLVALQDDYEQLNRALNGWVADELNDTLRQRRERVAQRLLRAWQAQGDDEVLDAEGRRQGLRLLLNDLPTDSLPILPAPISFYHVTILVLKETTVSVVHSDFLKAFTYLQELDMSHNQLLRCPSGLGYLTNLRRLRLAHNRIRLDAQTTGELNSLPRLSHLDLSDNNPLGAYEMRFHHLPHLVELALRRCGLSEWPVGLELCGFLQRADLRDNQLRSVPAALLAMPQEFRQGILIDGNRLSMTDIGRLSALDALTEEVVEIDSRTWWLSGDWNTTEQGALWDRLSADEENVHLFSLLDTLQKLANFSWPESELRVKGWNLLTAMDRSPPFAIQVREVVESVSGDDNLAIEMFCSMLRLNAEHDALLDSSWSKGAELFELGRALQKLDRLHLYVEQERPLLAAAGLDVSHLELRFRARLRRQLQLRFQPLRIRQNPAVAALGRTQLDLAEMAVRQGDVPGALAVDLCQRTFWQEHLKHVNQARFANLERLLTEQRAILDAQRAALGEEGYNAAVQALDGQARADLSDLRLQLTRTYLRSIEGRAS